MLSHANIAKPDDTIARRNGTPNSHGDYTFQTKKMTGTGFSGGIRTNKSNNRTH